METLENLLLLMARLRDPESGSPWEQAQTFESISGYTLEEAYELVDSIRRGDMKELESELGDLLLQVIFHAQIGKEQGLFDFESVTRRLAEKLEKRLPHMYGRAPLPKTAEEQNETWQAMKGPKPAPESVFDTIPASLPPYEAMVRAQKACMAAGWRWPSVQPALEKTREELAEVEEAVAEGDKAHLTEELGDLIFMATVLCHYLDVEPAEAIAAVRRKHERRFRHIEKRAKETGCAIGAFSGPEEREWYAEIKDLEKRQGRQ